MAFVSMTSDPRAVLARGEEIEAELAVIAGQENRLVARTVGLVAEAIEDGLCLAPDLSVRRWVAWRFGCSAARADLIATVAERRPELPALMAALADGAVSLDQAAVIARRVPASHDAEAADKAQLMRPCQLRRWANTTPPLNDTVPDRPARHRHRLSIRPATDHDGGDWLLSGRLPGEVGAGLDTALRAQLDALWAAHRRGDSDAVGDDTSPGPTRIDALAQLVERAQGTQARLRPHSARTKVIVHVDLDTKLARFHAGPAVPASLRRYLSCDATFQTLYERAGVALGIGRASHEIPTRTRLAVEQRDGGCRTPGCGRTHVQIHHVIHWEDGGPTETWNLIALCPHHHRLHHRGRLQITGANADDPNGIHFSVGGRQLDARPPPATGDRLPPPPTTNPYRHPEWGHIPNWAMVPPPLANPPNETPAPDPPPVSIRIGRDGEPIDYPDEIVLDEREDE